MFERPIFYYIDKVYRLIVKTGSNLQSLFLLYMRAVWGHQFFLSGLQKFKNLDEVAQFFESIHIPFPHLNATLVSTFEALCGFCIFFGFASRLAAIPTAIITITAIAAAHSQELTHLSFLFDPAMLAHQPPYPFLLTACIIFCFGPGKISVDAWIKRVFNK